MTVDELLEPLYVILPPAVARVVLAMAITIIGYAIARFLGHLARRFFRHGNARLLGLVQTEQKHAGVESALETEREDSTSVTVAGAIVFWIVFPLFLLLGASVLGFPGISEWLDGFNAYLPSVLAAAVSILLGVLFGRFLRLSVQAAADAMGYRRAQVLGRSAQILVIVLSVIVAIDQLGLEITLLIIVTAIILSATLGGAALSFGLGAQSAVANLVACHYLSKWYRVGQTIRIGEHEGRITEILPAAVVLQTETGRVYVPAKLFAERESLLLDDEGRE